jgi:uncharacterized protein (DUF433 family)
VSKEFSSATSRLTRREAAELSGTTLSTVNKAIEQRVLRGRQHKGRLVLSPEDVGALAVLARTRVVLPVALKKRVAAWARSGPGANAELRLDGALVVRIGTEVEEAVQRARRYVELRDRLVEVDPSVRGGAPVIRGTRVPIRGLARQIEGGETPEVLREEFWFMPAEAFELAPLWARANPRQGRPRRPWAADESAPATKPSTDAQAA